MAAVRCTEGKILILQSTSNASAQTLQPKSRIEFVMAIMKLRLLCQLTTFRVPGQTSKRNTISISMAAVRCTEGKILILQSTFNASAQTLQPKSRIEFVMAIMNRRLFCQLTTFRVVRVVSNVVMSISRGIYFLVKNINSVFFEIAVVQ